MSIRDDLEAIKPTKPLTFYHWFNKLDGEDQAALTEAATSDLSSSAILTIVKRNGGVGSKETIDAWRSKIGQDS